MTRKLISLSKVNCHIFFCIQQKGYAPVSPGPMTDESAFVNVASKYQLPEYTTAFLLAKDVSMIFRGIDASTSSLVLKQSALSHFSGSYGPFSAAPSFSAGHTASNLQVSSQSDGLHVDIPGAQVIGYYTAVLPSWANGVNWQITAASFSFGYVFT